MKSKQVLTQIMTLINHVIIIIKATSLIMLNEVEEDMLYEKLTLFGARI